MQEMPTANAAKAMGTREAPMYFIGRAEVCT